MIYKILMKISKQGMKMIFQEMIRMIKMINIKTREVIEVEAEIKTEKAQ